ncbi:response regulator [Clostridium felsineum]|uniref:response regulator transcription factor n=1 Tax=Clostridium felsineum TaxID=36839 RepID=UPI00214D8632|nr:response regulator [Clostridium felsineum]MCR3761472.1 response regulator [Clostridium felsineum]
MINIFIADDDKIIRRGLKKIVEENMKGFKVVGEASNGLRALEKMKEIRPDILITDIKMPVMSGIELINNLNEFSLGIKPVVLSGFDDYIYVRESFKKGVVDYLLKPIDNNNLFMILGKIKDDIEEERLENEKIKESFLRNIIKKNYIEGEDYKEAIRKLKINEIGDFYLLAIKSDNKIKNFFLYLEEVKKKSKRIIREEHGVESIICPIEEYVIILIYSSSKEVKLDKNKMLKIVNMLELNMCFSKKTFSCGMYGYHNIRESHMAIKKAKIALNSSFYNGLEAYYLYDNVHKFNDISEKIVSLFLQKVNNSLELCKEQETIKEVEGFFELVYNDKVNPSKVREVLLNLVYKMKTSVKETNCMEKSLSELEYAIKNIATYVELKEYFVVKICHIIKEILKIKIYKDKRVIEKAKKYINENYMKEVTLKKVAEYVYLNPNYFSELFKNEVGKNFIDYVIETRIKASKQLLKETNLKVYEIAEIVGYNEAVSFTRAFKKVVGVSPKKYVELVG